MLQYWRLILPFFGYSTAMIAIGRIGQGIPLDIFLVIITDMIIILVNHFGFKNENASIFRALTFFISMGCMYFILLGMMVYTWYFT
jgi:hypothetical protein